MRFFWRERIKYHQLLPSKTSHPSCCISLSRYCQSRRRKIIIFFGCLLSAALITYNYMTSEFYRNRMEPKVMIHQPQLARCCRSEDERIDLCGRPECLWPCPVMPDDHLSLPVDQDKAFFLETSGRSAINYRQSCAVESLAVMNPNLTIHLLMTGQLNRTAPTMRVISEYPNVQMTRINLGDYVAGTPLEHWYFCTEWNRGWYAVAHLSDGLRLLTLSKYGGYYFDLDIIHLKPVTHLRNFVVSESFNKVGNNAIHADSRHPLITQAVEEFHTNYKWYVWPHNGPDLLTRLLVSWCGQDHVSWMTPERCRGFHILPRKSFHPVEYLFWRNYFYQRDESDHYNWPDETIGAHVWNSFSAALPVRKTSNQYYVQMARTACPRTFASAPEEF